MQICPYEVYCPTGPYHIPLGGFRADVASSRAPIADYPDGWVQVGSESSCVQYTIFGDEEGGGGNAKTMDAAEAVPDGAAEKDDDDDETDSAATANIDKVLVENNESSGGEDNVEEQGGLVEETYVPMVKPEPSMVKPGDDETDSAATAIIDKVIVENNESSGGGDNVKEQGGLVEETYVPIVKPEPSMVEPGPSAVAEELLANSKDQEQQADTAVAPEASKEQVPALASQQPSAPNAASAATNSKVPDMTNILHQKFKPLWLSSREGWNGGSHADAIKFCESVRGKKLCPYSAMCPKGPGHAVMGGRHHLEFDVKGEQYAPVMGGENHWVMIGSVGGEGDEDGGSSKCMTHRQLQGRAPEWGLNGDRAEVKQHVMCCTIN